MAHNGVTKFVSRSKAHWLDYTILIFLVLATYWVGGTSLSIFGDEWIRVDQIIHGTAICPGSTNIFLRPLLDCYPYFLNILFGLNIQAFHFLSVVILGITALVLFRLLMFIFPAWRLFNLVATSLFMVYPASFPHTFFERGTFQLSLLFFILSLLFLYAYLHTGSTRYLLAAIGILVVSLALYEAQIGLGLVIPLLYYFHDRSKTKKHYFGCLLYWAISFIFMVGRLVTQLSVGSAFGHSTEKIVLNPKTYLYRLALGYKISLLDSWIEALEAFGKNIQPVVPLLALVSSGLFILLCLRFYIDSRAGRTNQETAPGGLKTAGLLILVGLLLLSAGYFPMLLAFTPSLSYLPSRININPGIGAVLVICALILGGLAIILKNSHQRQFVFSLVAFPLIIIGSFTQIDSQHDTEIGWMEQKEFWQNMFTTAPGIKPGTHFLLFLPGYQEHRGAKPFESGPSGFSSVFHVLYGQSKISGYFTYSDFDISYFEGTGVINPWKNEVIPYEQSVALLFNRKTHEVGTIWSAELPLCNDCFVETPTSYTNWRFLVNR